MYIYMSIYIYTTVILHRKKNNHEMFQEIGDIPPGLSAAAPGGDHRPGHQRKAGEYLDVNPS